VANFACRLAKHRGSDHLEVKDLQLHLEMHHGIRIPGFSVDQATQPHSSAAQASGAGGAGGTMSANIGGNKKAAATAGAVANMKRSARLAAVNQAKKDARLL
jgi:transcription initiation factor TFIID subunit 12